MHKLNNTNVIDLFQAPVQSGSQPSPEIDAAFEELWKLWPTKAKKPLAKAKFRAICAGSFTTRTLDKDSGQYVEIEVEGSADDILAGCKAYLKGQIDTKTYRLKDDGKYIPHLATFLNGGRFSDHL